MTTRPPLARMLRIHERLQDGHFTNCRKLADELEVSTKTIMRDLAFMRDQLNLPTEYDAGTQSWRYAYPVKNFPTVQISEGEMLALLVARKALEQYRGTPYHDQLARAFEKLSSGLKARISFSASGTLDNVSFHQTGLGHTDLAQFEKLSRAVHASVEITFDYRKPRTARTEKRRVQPYHLANRDNAWYLIGYDRTRRALRHYAVLRMTSVTLTTRTFVRPADFSPAKHFGKAFGVFVGDGEYQVTLRFSSAVAEEVRERLWHESQQTRELPGGGLELTLHVGHLTEIQRWVLSWGEHVEVLSPAELREAIRRRASVTAALYTG